MLVMTDDVGEVWVESSGGDPFWRTSKIRGFGLGRMSIMESMGSKKKSRPRRSFTAEFKAEIVELCQRGDRSIGQVARDFDLTETAVREWVKQAERDAGTRADGGLTTTERDELAQLRRENRRLREDVEVLKRATAFFAKETR
jgi:transposase